MRGSASASSSEDNPLSLAEDVTGMCRSSEVPVGRSRYVRRLSRGATRAVRSISINKNNAPVASAIH